MPDDNAALPAAGTDDPPVPSPAPGGPVDRPVPCPGSDYAAAAAGGTTACWYLVFILARWQFPVGLLGLVYAAVQSKG